MITTLAQIKELDPNYFKVTSRDRKEQHMRFYRKVYPFPEGALFIRRIFVPWGRGNEDNDQFEYLACLDNGEITYIGCDIELWRAQVFCTNMANDPAMLVSLIPGLRGKS